MSLSFFPSPTVSSRRLALARLETALHRRWANAHLPLTKVRHALALVLGPNLLLPGLHVSYTKLRWMSPLPLELIRLFRPR